MLRLPVASTLSQLSKRVSTIDAIINKITSKSGPFNGGPILRIVSRNESNNVSKNIVVPFPTRVVPVHIDVHTKFPYLHVVGTLEEDEELVLQQVKTTIMYKYYFSGLNINLTSLQFDDTIIPHREYVISYSDLRSRYPQFPDDLFNFRLTNINNIRMINDGVGERYIKGLKFQTEDMAVLEDRDNEDDDFNGYCGV